MVIYIFDESTNYSCLIHKFYKKSENTSNFLRAHGDIFKLL